MSTSSSSDPPLPDIEPREGTVSVEDVTTESRILAYEALRDVADQIVKRVKELDPSRVVLMSGDRLPAALRSFHAFKVEAESLKDLWEAIERQAEEAGKEVEKDLKTSSVWMAALASVMDLLAYARYDVEISGAKVEIDDEALLILVAGKLDGEDLDVTAPQLFPQLSPASAASGKGQQDHPAGVVSQKLQDARKTRAEAVVAVDQLPDGDEKKGLTARIAELRKVHDAFEDRLFKADSETGTTPMVELVEGAALSRALEEESAFALCLRVLDAGGSNRTRRFLFWSPVDHSGGAIGSFAVFDRTGRLKDADILRFYSGYQQVPKGSGDARGRCDGC